MGDSVGRRPRDASTYQEVLLYESAVDWTNYDKDMLPYQQRDVFRYSFPNSMANAIGIVFYRGGIHRDSLYSESSLSSLDVLRLSIAKLIKPKEFISGDAILFCHALYDNYYHFMLECLPRLFCLKSEMDRGSTCIIMPAVRSSFHSQWLDVIGLESNVRNVDIGKIIVARRLNVCSFPANSGNHNRTIICEYSKWLLDNVRAARTTESLFDSRLPSKIFVGRKAGKRRTIVNMDEVTTLLGNHGYAYVELEEMSVCDQVSLFHNADRIVAIHGAGLANILFCRENTEIFELINKNFHYYTFSKLSSCLNLKHERVQCEPVNSSVDPTALNHCDILVDCAELRRII